MNKNQNVNALIAITQGSTVGAWKRAGLVWSETDLIPKETGFRIDYAHDKFTGVLRSARVVPLTDNADRELGATELAAIVGVLNIAAAAPQGTENLEAVLPDALKARVDEVLAENASTTTGKPRRPYTGTYAVDRWNAVLLDIDAFLRDHGATSGVGYITALFETNRGSAHRWMAEAREWAQQYPERYAQLTVLASSV